MKLLLGLCMCTSLLRCTPDLALAESGGSLSMVSMATAPDRLREWIAPPIEYHRPVMRPLALRMIAGAVALAL